MPQVAEVTDCIPRGQCSVSVSPIPGEPDAYTVTVTIVATDANAKGSLQNAQPQDGPWWLTRSGLRAAGNADGAPTGAAESSAATAFVRSGLAMRAAPGRYVWLRAPLERRQAHIP